MSGRHDTDAYARAGIDDVGAFYRTKFVSDEVLHHAYFQRLSRFDLRYARTLWVYDNVRAGSRVLDLGCGAGMLALLKRKGVALFGVDLSEVCAQAARNNGYDGTVAAALDHLPFADHSFDYVCSLDVIGHIEPAQQDAVVAEIARVLRPDGVTLHGIECTEAQARRSYDEMSPADLARFVAVDGHVGLAEEHDQATLFARRFASVDWRSRFLVTLSSDEFLKQADRYGALYEADWLEYLRSLSFSERRAFDMAMGYAFGMLSDLDIRLPRSGFYVFVKARHAGPGPFYNEHRDRRALLADAGAPSGSRCLDRDSDCSYDAGWFEANNLPPVARWMGRAAAIDFAATRVRRIGLDVATYMPDIHQRPLSLRVSLESTPIELIAIERSGWTRIDLVVPERVQTSASSRFRLQFEADRTYQPRPAPDQRDDRELSVAICNLEIFD
jgi:SAM-dependent methyltransferase